MGGCEDKRYGEMLEMYMLDLLDESDQKEFELHLMKCEKCSAAVEDFNEVSMLVLNSPRARDLVSEMLSEEEGDGAAEPQSIKIARGKREKWFPRLAAAFSVAAILLLLILKPWHVEIGPDKMALAQENRLAVIPFENLAADDNRSLLGRAASSLLITDLSEGGLVQVISHQQYQDIIRVLGYKDITYPDLDLASQVAEKSGARWLLMGTIRELEPRMILDIALINYPDGDTVFHKQISGAPGDDIFAVVDRLSKTIRGALAEYSADSAGSDRPVADITTHSLPAYLNYVEGVENYYKLYMAEAKRNLEKAIAYDSSFAMAYYYLSLIDDRNLIEKAVKYQDRAGRRERYYIRSQAACNRGDTAAFVEQLKDLIGEYPDEKIAYYNLGSYLYQMGEYDEAKEYLVSALKLDSLYTLVYNQLAYLYDRMGDYDSALWAVNRYIFISPDEANPYDTRGDLYVNHGQLELAMESYKMAIEIKPDFTYAAVKLGNLYHWKRDYAEAEKWYRWRLPERSLTDSLGVAVELANILMAQGRITTVVDFLDQALERCEEYSESSGMKLTILTLRMRKTLALLEKDPQRALAEVEIVLQAGGQSHMEIMQFFAQVLAKNGRFARVREVIRRLDSLSAENQRALYSARYSRGCLEMEQGNFDAAVEYFQKAVELSSPETDFIGHFMLARAYLGAGRAEEAISVLNYQLARYNPERLRAAVWNAQIDYYLGKAYEDRGSLTEAKEHYRRFLEMWENADADLPSLIDARSRLRQITS